jgi:hypothetical protein
MTVTADGDRRPGSWLITLAGAWMKRQARRIGDADSRAPRAVGERAGSVVKTSREPTSPPIS